MAIVVAGRERMAEVEGLLVVDEDAHVPADAVLLVDHAKAQARIARVEIG